MNTMKTSEVLDLAADQILFHGWGKGTAAWEGGGGQGLCLEGAIAAAAGVGRVQRYGLSHINIGELNRCPAYLAVAEYLRPHLEGLKTVSGQPAAPWYFNDRIAESVEDVIAVLRAAAAVERTKEAYETEDQPLPVEIPAASAA